MNGTASLTFTPPPPPPINVNTAVYTRFMLTCIETYACCRIFFIIVLHQVHFLYMLIDCDRHVLYILKHVKSHYSCYLALVFYQLIKKISPLFLIIYSPYSPQKWLFVSLQFCKWMMNAWLNVALAAGDPVPGHYYSPK